MNKHSARPRYSAIIGAACLGLALFTATAGAADNSDLEKRVERLEKLSNNSALLQMNNQITQLQQEVQTLRGELEVVKRQLDDIKQRQRTLYQDVDRRLLNLEQNTKGPGASGDAQPGGQQPQGATAPNQSAGGGTQPNAGANGAKPGDQPQQQNGGNNNAAAQEYHAAFNLLKQGNYKQASQAFETFLDQHGDSSYADNAVYWLGESHYVVREFDQAKQFFQRVLKDYPNSGKRPDALLKLGYIQYEQQDWAGARKLLTEVTDKYPQSTAATLAQNRLRRMKQEGH